MRIEGKSLLFKCVDTGKLNIHQWLVTHPRVFGLYKLNLIGKKKSTQSLVARERKVNLGRVVEQGNNKNNTYVQNNQNTVYEYFKELIKYFKNINTFT